MLVDALREDFVFGPNGRMYMPYTRHVVERGSSHSFVAKARPPTVTMPRIKVGCHQHDVEMRTRPSNLSTVSHHGVCLLEFWISVCCSESTTWIQTISISQILSNSTHKSASLKLYISTLLCSENLKRMMPGIFCC